MKRLTLAKASLTAAVGAMALGAAAQAQPYGYYGSGGYAYDACKRDKTQRGTVGALIGGAMGAVIGSNAAARGVRTEGSLLGGALGAAVGAGVGNSMAACRTGSYETYSPGYGHYDAYDRGYYADSGYRYGGDYNDGWAYGRRGERYRVAEDRVDADGCTLAESPIHMPDGRTEMRFVRVCRDASGRYAVVD